MAEALVSIVLERLASIGRQQAEDGIRLIAGAEQEVEKIQSNFRSIQAILADAESRQIKDNAVRDWLDKLKDVSYDIDDVLDEWNTKIQKLQVKEAENASSKSLKRKLDIIAVEKDRFNFSSIIKGSGELEQPMTASVVDLTKVHGRDEDRNALVNLLLSPPSQQVLPIITIVGLGGIGKTTLARVVYNDDKVKNHFDERIWVYAFEPFDELRIAKAILESLTNSVVNLTQLESVLRSILHRIGGKKFLIVLDDVWTENPGNWDQLMESLKCGSQESRILVTTRKENVANILGATNIISLGTLSDLGSWKLFSQIAFSGRTIESEELEIIGRKIVQKCKGLPLAIKTLAGLLRFKEKPEEWRNVIDNEIWKLKEAKQGLFPPLLLSYYDLAPMLKKCFLYCAIFPKDYDIEKDKLIKLWMSQNYLKTNQNRDMELIGEEYFETLATRSCFHDFTKNDFPVGSIRSIKIHDVMHDVAKFLIKNESKSSPSYDKTFRSLVANREGSEYEMALSKLFDQSTSLRTLDLSELSIKKLPRDVEKLIHLRYLNLANSDIKVLPETICELYNLQTLDIRYCRYLQKLPQAIGKLINLTYLENDWESSISYMPKSLQRLTCLRTLNEFVISDDSYGSNVCSIEYLKNFLHIRVIGIKALGNLTDVGMVKKAELNNKKHLRVLRLDFKGSMDKDNELLLKAMQPPLNLEKLVLSKYRGNSLFSNWMMPLTRLKELILRGFINCEHLPSSGKLSFLEFLYIRDWKNVKKVGNEFLGIESCDEASSSLSPVITFPRLKFLLFWDIEEWEEWNYNITKRADKDITVRPCLQTLRICKCHKLQSLPNHLQEMTTLKKEIIGCPLLLKKLQRTDSSSSSPPVIDQDLSNP